MVSSLEELYVNSECRALLFAYLPPCQCICIALNSLENGNTYSVLFTRRKNVLGAVLTWGQLKLLLNLFPENFLETIEPIGFIPKEDKMLTDFSNCLVWGYHSSNTQKYPGYSLKTTILQLFSSICVFFFLFISV